MGFKVTEDHKRARFVHRNAYIQSSKGNNSRVYIQELCFLHFACYPLLVNNSVKFHEGILDGFKVIVRTQFCHRNYYLQYIYIQEL